MSKKANIEKVILYQSRKKEYFFEVKVLSFLYFAFMIMSAVLLVLDILRVIMLLVFVVCFYNFYNNLIIKINIEKIKINDEHLTLYALDKTYQYKISEIDDMKIKQYDVDDKLYLHIRSKGKNFKFLIKIKIFNNNIELIDDLIKIVKTVNPNSQIFNKSKKMNKEEKRCTKS